MSLDKAIAYGKEKRKKYKGAKAVDKQCRNHGDCPYCQENRNYKNKKVKYKLDEQEKDYAESEET